MEYHNPYQYDDISEGGTTLSSRSDLHPNHPNCSSTTNNGNLTFYWLQEPYVSPNRDKDKKANANSVRLKPVDSSLHRKHRLALAIMSCLVEAFFDRMDATSFTRMKIEDIVRHPRLKQILRPPSSSDHGLVHRHTDAATGTSEEYIKLSMIACCKDIIVSLLPGTNQFLNNACPFIRSIESLQPRKQLMKAMLKSIQIIENKLHQHPWGGSISSGTHRNYPNDESDCDDNVVDQNDSEASSRESETDIKASTTRTKKKKQIRSPFEDDEDESDVETAKSAIAPQQHVEGSPIVISPEHRTRTVDLLRQKRKRQYELLAKTPLGEESESASEETDQEEEQASDHEHKMPSGSHCYHDVKKQRLNLNPYGGYVKRSYLTKEERYTTPKVDIPAFKLSTSKKKKDKVVLAALAQAQLYSTERMNNALVRTSFDKLQPSYQNVSSHIYFECLISRCISLNSRSKIVVICPHHPVVLTPYKHGNKSKRSDSPSLMKTLRKTCSRKLLIWTYLVIL